ncbi:hypothetical protein WJX72_002073 [[Myrmecia] bisecta]|uniref:Uncharacterized protein n=1 Tax=[Myrmecia] bisecta TaxID=41462 RepID=A0AAW1R5J2_9CHLO
MTDTARDRADLDFEDSYESDSDYSSGSDSGHVYTEDWRQPDDANQDLKFYEIRELTSGPDIAPECRRLAVAVNRSGFSLRALEELLADNKRLTSTAEKSTSALESMHHLVREQNQAVAKAQMKAAELDAQLRRSQEACMTAENEVATLRQQLQRSDQLRLQGQKALDELKREFEALTRDITAEGLSRTYSSPSRAPTGRGLESSNGRRDMPRADARMAAVLEKLCDDKVLSRLERFIDAANNDYAS